MSVQRPGLNTHQLQLMATDFLFFIFGVLMGYQYFIPSFLTLFRFSYV